MVDQIGRAIAKADGADFERDPLHYRKLAQASRRWFDGFWLINRRADFKKAVRAMIGAAMTG